MQFGKILPALLALAASESNHHALAAIEWKETLVPIASKIDDSVVEAEFHFVNSGSRPVSIRSVKPDCACTKIKLEKATWQPGEKGEIVARFDIGTNAGILKKRIVVETDEGTGDSVILQIVALVPNFWTVFPNSLLWKRGEARSPKTLSLNFQDVSPIKMTGVSSNSPGFIAESTVPDGGRNYVITVRPSTVGAFEGRIDIQTDFPRGHSRMLSIPVRSE
jgi:hypothetical protein